MRARMRVCKAYVDGAHAILRCIVSHAYRKINLHVIQFRVVIQMKRIMRKILVEMLKNSKRSDREIAKLVGVSQPTVTRTRSRLVKEGVIKEFTVIPNLSEMGFEILAINCFRTKVGEEVRNKAREKTMASPNILFSARCQGGGKNGMTVSLHRNYTDYSKFISTVLSEGADEIEDHETYLISLKDFIAKPFSFQGIAKLFEE